MTTKPARRNCYCGPGSVRHDYGDGQYCKDNPAGAEIIQPTRDNVLVLSELPPHRRHADAFEDAHMTAAGAVMGARMAGKNIPAWTSDMNDAFRAAAAEAFDAGYRARQEAN